MFSDLQRKKFGASDAVKRGHGGAIGVGIKKFGAIDARAFDARGPRYKCEFIAYLITNFAAVRVYVQLMKYGTYARSIKLLQLGNLIQYTQIQYTFIYSKILAALLEKHHIFAFVLTENQCIFMTMLHKDNRQVSHNTRNRTLMRNALHSLFIVPRLLRI
jgi:hypothetical protein